MTEENKYYQVKRSYLDKVGVEENLFIVLGHEASGEGNLCCYEQYSENLKNRNYSLGSINMRDLVGGFTVSLINNNLGGNIMSENNINQLQNKFLDKDTKTLIETGVLNNDLSVNNAMFVLSYLVGERKEELAKAARENTVNFARHGSWGRVLSWVIPYLNAGIQGSRTFVRNVSNRPTQTGVKVILTSFMPMAAVTTWNLSDPARKAAYDDISDFEKENNFIIVPENPIKDDKSR